MRSLSLAWIVVLVLVGNVFAQEAELNSPRIEYPLDGVWEMQVDGTDTWKQVAVPGTFEAQVAVDFDGIATYRRAIDPVPLSKERRLLLHFDAVATHAEVWFNDVLVGEHLGAWTPFRFDVTDAALSRPEGPWEVKIRVDERVGHNTQGFLPIIAPHFGGIWQSVRLLKAPVSWIDENSVLAFGNTEKQFVKVAFDWHGSEMPEIVALSFRKQGNTNWTSLITNNIQIKSQTTGQSRVMALGKLDTVNEPEQRLKPWSPNDPALFEVRIEVRDAAKTKTLDSSIVRFACREIRPHPFYGFYLNGEQLNLRGVLNWGYAPPRTAPSLDEAFMRNEIELARSCGFNMMKFCLWVPPKRYLELCDELGMLAWIEYPTWHPDFSPEKLEELQAEYDEFFFHDRNHPSVILRSLTCETGPSADLGVIQALYERCHEMVPGAIVVDDSSWIAWNRVHDFYDDHPYGNNHTWVEELTKLKDYIAGRRAKPLMLGEAIAADTWTDPEWFHNRDESEWHLPLSLESARQWLNDARSLYGEKSIDKLLPDSKKYGMLMRKFQMETFRREVPGGGYVVSVIRDFPKAAMGLVDFRGERKWSADDWTWHGELMLLLGTETDRRSFSSGDDIEWELTIAMSAVEAQKGHQLEFGIVAPDGTRTPVRPGPDESKIKYSYSWSVKHQLPEVNEPNRYLVFANLYDQRDNLIARNTWPIWIVPKTSADNCRVQLHPTASEFRELLGECGAPIVDSSGGADSNRPTPMLTRIIDEQVVQYMADGGSVLVLPNNGPGSLPLESYWFLRGGPVLSERHAAFGEGDSLGWLAPRDMMVELQHFDLAGDVVRDVDYLDSIDPLFMLWESHDLDEVKTNGLLYRMPVGEKGELVVSALRHDGAGNAVGKYLLGRLLKGMSDQRFTSADNVDGRGVANLARLRAEFAARQLSIESMDWRFQPDPDQGGIAANWQAVDFDDSAWETIHADRHWESQGHDSLDGWAWYRLSFDIPADWPAGKAFLNFTGVDDYYDLYLNGEKVGSAGDIEKRETAFELRTSHDISEHLKPGKPLQITVAVYDWYGAGGIFRPVTLSTQPISDQRRILK